MWLRTSLTGAKPSPGFAHGLIARAGQTVVEANQRIRALLTVIPALPAFYARYPDVKIEIVSTDRPIDVIEDGFDVAIRCDLGNRCPGRGAGGNCGPVFQWQVSAFVH